MQTYPASKKGTFPGLSDEELLQALVQKHDAKFVVLAGYLKVRMCGRVWDADVWRLGRSGVLARGAQGALPRWVWPDGKRQRLPLPLTNNVTLEWCNARDERPVCVAEQCPSQTLMSHWNVAVPEMSALPASWSNV
eukprot:363192-Chlamydomonas_euryale.AAC.17